MLVNHNNAAHQCNARHVEVPCIKTLISKLQVRNHIGISEFACKDELQRPHLYSKRQPMHSMVYYATTCSKQTQTQVQMGDISPRTCNYLKTNLLKAFGSNDKVIDTTWHDLSHHGISCSIVLIWVSVS